MFKLSDNILLCLQACSLWTNNRCWAGLKNSAHCIMYKGLARKHKEQGANSIKVGSAFTMCPRLLPVRLCCYICMGLMLQQDTETKGEPHTARVFISSELSATDMASHHLTHRVANAGPLSFSWWGDKALSCSYEWQQHQEKNASEAHIQFEFMSRLHYTHPPAITTKHHQHHPLFFSPSLLHPFSHQSLSQSHHNH